MKILFNDNKYLKKCILYIFFVHIIISKQTVTFKNFPKLKFNIIYNVYTDKVTQMIKSFLFYNTYMFISKCYTLNKCQYVCCFFKFKF